jgi:hypothetical protein
VFALLLLSIRIFYLAGARAPCFSLIVLPDFRFLIVRHFLCNHWAEPQEPIAAGFSP